MNMTRVFEYTATYTVEAIVEENRVKFTVLDEAGAMICDGSIKWDGCSNWHFDPCVHFCGKQQSIDLGTLFGSLYDWALELMPQHEEWLKD